ncbi:MAG TPA: GNAT family N-acetyltransferase, partial [Candidatus Eisenbacteria bacterium]|nr:GNAT family N-acetyltransferase [Candidatus Eisenbacteria bacterium]
MIERIERFEGAPPDGWNDLVRRLGGTVFHSAEWADYQRASSGGTSWFLAAFAGSEPVGGSVATLHRSSRPILSHLFRSLEVASHPFGADAAARGQILRALESLGRETGCATIDLQSFQSGESPIRPERHGYREAERVEFVVDLSRGLDEVWRGIGKGQRERIRKLERLGLAVAIGTERSDLEALRAARQETHDKRVRRGQAYALTGDDAFYDRLHRWVLARGIGRLFVARKEGVPVAALLFSTFHRRAYSMFSGSSEEGYKLGAQSLLFWRAVESFHADAFTELNRGGVPGASEREDHPLHGIYAFKRQLGGTPVR